MLRLLPAPWRRGAWRLRACYQDAAASRQIARTSRLLNEPDPFFALFSDLLLGKMNLTPFFYQDAAASRQIARTSRLLNEPDPFFSLTPFFPFFPRFPDFPRLAREMNLTPFPAADRSHLASAK